MEEDVGMSKPKHYAKKVGMVLTSVSLNKPLPHYVGTYVGYISTYTPAMNR